MPLYDFEDDNGHRVERFYHTVVQRDAATVVCAVCDAPMRRMLSMGRGLTYFEEGRGQWIENLADKPVFVTSHGQHRRLMRENGVDWCTERTVKGSGGWI